MGKVNLPYVNSFKDRHGRWRYYYRRKGKLVPLNGEDLAADYARVHASFEGTATEALSGSFDELVETYYASAEFKKNLGESTKAEYKRHIEAARKRWGKPYADDGFGTIWCREQDRLKVKRPFHGLRKNATIMLLEAGCTTEQVQAITGHETQEMVAHYGKRVSQKRLAKEAMRKLTDKPPGTG